MIYCKMAYVFECTFCCFCHRREENGKYLIKAYENVMIQRSCPGWVFGRGNFFR